ncbi:hypothetical protein BJ546DRAFT_946572 [Cryomyces antarcticus]
MPAISPLVVSSPSTETEAVVDGRPKECQGKTIGLSNPTGTGDHQGEARPFFAPRSLPQRFSRDLTSNLRLCSGYSDCCGSSMRVTQTPRFLDGAATSAHKV